jgi:uncharacterized repeat protein (TIGR04138 family)
MNSQLSFTEKVQELVAEDAAIEAEAYHFLRDALEVALKLRKKARKDASGHVSAEELLEGFRRHALKEFGPMAETVFDYWGVHSCEDVGRMVFNLVKVGVFGKTEQDTMEAFRRGYDFHEAFTVPFLPRSEISSESAASAVHPSS